MLCIDTNVLVFATIRESPNRDLALRLLSRARETTTLAVTSQILREYIAVTTHPRFAPQPLEPAVALEDIAAFRANFVTLQENAEAADILVSLVRRHRIVGRLVHDANIAATMLANGVTRILTDNVADFRRFAPDIETVDLA
ncbi:MAG: PIN domain-containing protein [Tagaea sp.]|nr:PIN domain-containing protein [Tagaea sp.]